MLSVVQLHDQDGRRLAVVEEPRLRFVRGFDTAYAAARAAISQNIELSALLTASCGNETIAYDDVYSGQSHWRLLCPFDHPTDPAHVLVSGTGLTHLGSARDRQAMHDQSHAPGGKHAEENLTDSMKMFRWGVERGKPQPGQLGVAPEWFYKGNGAILRPANEPLETPGYAEDGGEEAEIAGIYLIADDGIPRRVGMTVGNEFSDHRFEKRNYLNLAGSKIRTCSIGPELILDPAFDSVPGLVTIERSGQTVWSKAIRTGEAEMCHSLANIEHHHFKFDTHRIPGDVHVHFYGACALSFGDGIRLDDGDVMSVTFERFGRPLRNPCRVAPAMTEPISTSSLR